MGLFDIENKLETTLKDYAASYGDAPHGEHPWSCVDAFKELASMDAADGSSYKAMYPQICHSRAEVQDAFIRAFIETRMNPLM